MKIIVIVSNNSLVPETPHPPTPADVVVHPLCYMKKKYFVKYTF